MAVVPTLGAQNTSTGGPQTSAPQPPPGATLFQPLAARLPYGVCCGAAAWTGQSFYLFGGYGAGSHEKGAIQFTPATGSVANLGNVLPVAVGAAAAAYAQGAIYVLGGLETPGALIRFDPSTGHAELLSVEIPAGRYPTAAAWHGEAYFFSGWDVDQVVWRYDPATGTRAASSARIPGNAGERSAVAVGDYIYLIGGDDADGAILRYDPAHDAFATMAARFPDGLRDAAVAWDGRQVWVMGGTSSSPAPYTVEPRVWRYDPSNDTLLEASYALPEGRNNLPGFWDDSRLFLLGGSSAAGSSDEVLWLAPSDAASAPPAPSPGALEGVAITHYTLVQESQASGQHTGDDATVTDPPNVVGTYHREFLYSGWGVAMQGTGLAANGKYIHYVSGGGGWTADHAWLNDPSSAVFAEVSGVTGSSGRTLAEDYSVAVDPQVIPLGSSVWIETQGHWYRADDTGGEIRGRHIDIYMGASGERPRATSSRVYVTSAPHSRSDASPFAATMTSSAATTATTSTTAMSTTASATGSQAQQQPAPPGQATGASGTGGTSLTAPAPAGVLLFGLAMAARLRRRTGV